MIDTPIQISVSASLGGAILGAQIVQIGFEASMLRQTVKNTTRLNYIEDEGDEGSE